MGAGAAAAVLASGSLAATPRSGITKPPAEPVLEGGAVEATGGIAKPAAIDGGVETPGVFSTVVAGLVSGLAANDGTAAGGNANPGAVVGGVAVAGGGVVCAVAVGVVGNVLCEPGSG